MSMSLGRWRDSKRAISVRDRQVSVDAHQGDRWDFLDRHVRESLDYAFRSGRERSNYAQCLFRRICDDGKSVRCAADHVLAHASDQDEFLQEWNEATESERWKFCRELGDDLLEGEYEPGPERLCRIPKGIDQDGNDRGYRILRIREIEDRIVERAILQIIQPFVDPTFHPLSFGGRPGKGTWHALASLEKLAVAGNRWYWVNDDVRDAFENVPINRTMDILGQLIPNDDVLHLVRRIIERTDGRKRGLRQGSPLSPFLLNLYLDRLLDQKWQKEFPAFPLIRYIDDIVILTESREQAEEAHESLTRLLTAAGMPLKGEDPVIVETNQRGALKFLGFELRQNPGKESETNPALTMLRITESAWGEFEETIIKAATEPDTDRIKDMAMGWINAFGPALAYEDFSSLLHRITGIITNSLQSPSVKQKHGAQPITAWELRQQWNTSKAKWRKLRANVFAGREHQSSEPDTEVLPHAVRRAPEEPETPGDTDQNTTRNTTQVTNNTKPGRDLSEVGSRGRDGKGEGFESLTEPGSQTATQTRGTKVTETGGTRSRSEEPTVRTLPSEPTTRDSSSHGMHTNSSRGSAFCYEKSLDFATSTHSRSFDHI